MAQRDFTQSEFASLVERIYDCAVDPSAWSGTIEAIRLALDMHNASLDLFDLVNYRPLVSFRTGIPSQYLETMDQHTPELAVLWDGILVRTSRPLDEPAALRQVREDGFLRSRLYREWAEPQGLHDNLGLVMLREPTRVASLGMGRHESRGPVGERELHRLRSLAPHLRRAITIGSALEAASIAAKAFEALVDALSVGVVLVDPRARAVLVNRAGREILAEGAAVRLANGTLQVRQPCADAALKRAIGLADVGGAAMGSAGIGLPAAHPDGGMVVAHVLPLPRSSGPRHWLRDAIAAVFLTSSAAPVAIPLEALMALFDLTPAEARVLAAIGAGRTLAETASEIEVSDNTVRTHLGRIFSKTGTGRQADLVNLVGALKSPVAAPEGNLAAPQGAAT